MKPKPKRTHNAADGFNHAATTYNALATAKFLQELDYAWRRFWLKRGNVLPHVPTSYIITHDSNPNDFGGLSPQ